MRCITGELSGRQRACHVACSALIDAFAQAARAVLGISHDRITRIGVMDINKSDEMECIAHTEGGVHSIMQGSRWAALADQLCLVECSGLLGLLRLMLCHAGRQARAAPVVEARVAEDA